MLARLAKQLRLVSRQTEVTWRYGYHLPEVLAYRLNAQPQASGEILRVVEELNRNGVAKTSVDRLFPSDAPYRELQEEIGRLQQERQAQIAGARSSGRGGTQQTAPAEAQKTYSYEFFSGLPEPGTVHTRFASQMEFQQVADRYLGLHGHLRGANVWLTLVSHDEARQSQTWHRDPEDRYVFKIFVLLSDVDEGCGPFQYAPGSHMKSSNGRVKGTVKYGMTDDEMSVLVPRDRWVIGTGKPGTIIFADTRGYHKGGLAREHERTMFVAMYLAH